MTHGLFGNRACLLTAITQNAVDMGRIGHQATHFMRDRRKPGNGEIGKRGLQVGELASAEFLQHIFLGGRGEGGVNADEIIGLRAAFQPVHF